MTNFFMQLKLRWLTLKQGCRQKTSEFSRWIIGKFSHYLLDNGSSDRKFLCDFKQICFEVKTCDVLLIEGRNRASHIIRNITHSPWTHAALYIGTLADITDPDFQAKLKATNSFSPSTQLVLESDIGIGTVISPLTKYQNDHIRILRPQGLSYEDGQNVIAHAMKHLGTRYDLRHIFDLARFLFPWGIFPRRWRSSLFEHNALQPTKDICSSLLADAFASVNFPILPMVNENGDDLELIQRDSRLFTPSDFDYSPYFAVIKYPIFPMSDRLHSKYLPWRK